VSGVSLDPGVSLVPEVPVSPDVPLVPSLGFVVPSFPVSLGVSWSILFGDSFDLHPDPNAAVASSAASMADLLNDMVGSPSVSPRNARTRAAGARGLVGTITEIANVPRQC